MNTMTTEDKIKKIKNKYGKSIIPELYDLLDIYSIDKQLFYDKEKIEKLRKKVPENINYRVDLKEFLACLENKNYSDYVIVHEIINYAKSTGKSIEFNIISEVFKDFPDVLGTLITAIDEDYSIELSNDWTFFKFKYH